MNIFKGRYLAVCILAYGIGIYAAINFLKVDININIFYIYSAGFIICSLILIAIYNFLRLKENKVNIILSPVISLAFVLGVITANHTLNNCGADIKTFIGKRIILTGQVISDPSVSASGKVYGVTVKAEALQGIGKRVETNDRIKLYINYSGSNNMLQNGDRIQCITKVKEPENSGDFNFKNYLLSLKVAVSGSANAVKLLGSKENPDIIDKFNATALHIRNNILDSVDKILPGKSDKNALLKGILVGYKGDFSDNLKETVNSAGLAHIVAVSGMHVMYLIAAAAFFLRLLKVRKKYIPLIEIPLLILFASISGYTPSVSRAALMMAVYLLAYNMSRRNDSVTSLFIAGGVLLILNSYNLINAGFILSFSAALGIILFVSGFQRLFVFINQLPRIGKYINASASLTLASNIGVAWFLLYLFGRLPLGMLIGNLWVMPITAAVFFLGYANWLVCLIIPSAIYGFICQFFGIILKGLLWTIVTTGKLFSGTLFSITQPTLPSFTFLIYLTFITALLYFFNRKNTKLNHITFEK